MTAMYSNKISSLKERKQCLNNFIEQRTETSKQLERLRDEKEKDKEVKENEQKNKLNKERNKLQSDLLDVKKQNKDLVR